jgi:REP element-mobilizing transposase RayT
VRLELPKSPIKTMPRRAVPFLPDQYFHFYNRGNNRQIVFFERDNYLYFLRGLKKYVCERVEILCYSLMPTHDHILVKVKPPAFDEAGVTHAVSLAVQKFGISYTKDIEKRNESNESLQDFGSIRVDTGKPASPPSIR